MIKLQPFKLCLSRTSMTCIRNAMSSFRFVPVLVTLSPKLKTPKNKLRLVWKLAVAITLFSGSPFLDLLWPSYNMKIESRFINEDTVLHKIDARKSSINSSTALNLSSITSERKGAMYKHMCITLRNIIWIVTMLYEIGMVI